MSVPRYESYRDSGAEWLGEVPAHWKILKLSRLVDPCRAITYGIVQAGPDIDGGVPYIRPADMSDESGVRDENSLLRTSGDIAAAYRRSTVRAGDIVCSIGPSFGKVMVAPSSLDGANLTQGTARIAVNGDASSRYVFWTLRASSSVCQWESGIGGATFRSLNLEPLAATLVCCPPKSEQLAIAAFLDRETGKIDALVEAQRRLIELLKEKRQAVISHAVSKGLDPTVPMKDSGVEWLGEVPAHWDVVPLKRHLTVLSGYAFPSAGFSDDAEDVPLLRGVNIGVGQVRWDETVYWPKDDTGGLEAWQLALGDLVIGMDRPWIADGLRLAELRTSDLPCLLLQRVAALRPSEGILADYLKLSLQGEGFYHHCVPEMTGVSVPHISPGQIREFVVALPPPGEQLEICSAVRSAERQAEALVSEAETAIRLLQERRAALISATVTGKIDVRGLAAHHTERDAA